MQSVSDYAVSQENPLKRLEANWRLRVGESATFRTAHTEECGLSPRRWQGASPLPSPGMGCVLADTTNPLSGRGYQRVAATDSNPVRV